MYAKRIPLIACVLICGAAGSSRADAALAAQSFADHCFSPYLTADTAQEYLARPHTRVDFYDLRPFSSAAPSPAALRAATPGTDRRCEVAFDGAHVQTGIDGVLAGLDQEGIRTEAEIPTGFSKATGTEFIAARQLNPRRVAVVQVGTRPGPSGIETFINVERLDPLAEPLE